MANERVPRASVGAVIVTFHGNPAELRDLLDRVSAEVRSVVVVDNTPQACDHVWRELRAAYPDCRFIVNGQNLGLSKALNQGITAVLDAGCEWVLLLDQDSSPVAGMVERLVGATRQYAGTKPLAAVGPVIRDSKLHQPLPFVRYEASGFKLQAADADRPELIDTDMLITSGCLISADALRTAGLMDERFFIDGIDSEWCFRCLAAGYRLLGVSDAVLIHNLGSRMQFMPLTGRQVFVHAPFRQYHIMRNRILLYWRPYVPWRWKLHDFFRLAYRLIAFTLFVKPRMKNAKAMIAGIRDGLTRR